ncbi:protein serine/threonine kinase protein [Trichomonas vaginalis G3]|nr:protein serine/threonine kinase protein [Trichomonas vaginalis G3]KAI5539664.1 protein serine/threonine kinase protein [Trichomonas vaginalis G3]
MGPRVITSSIGNTVLTEYEFIKPLGEGSFGSVWLANNTALNYQVAIKVLPKALFTDTISITRLQREINLQKNMDHPFIAKLFHHIEDPENHYLVMEYVENGNLLDYVNENGRLNDEQARKYFLQLISVLDYLHNKLHIAHRDLKAENILLDKNRNIKVIDFGLSRQFTDADPQLQTACGSPAYAAPEMILGEPYDKSCDIWSAGILLYAISCRELPFDDNDTQATLRRIVYTEPVFPHYLSSALIDLLKKMLKKNPQKRITLEGIKNHHWFSQTQYSVAEPTDDVLTDETAIDKHVVDEMIELNIPIDGLNEAILAKDMNALTSLYEQLRRKHLNTPPEQRIPSAKTQIKDGQTIPPLKATLARPTTKFPFGAANKPRQLAAAQMGVAIPQRRMSRPVAVRRPIKPAIPPQQPYDARPAAILQ